MLRHLVIGFAALLLFSSGAMAQSCSGSTWNTLSNGNPADASQVMSNFNCVLGSPHFSGNVGIGTASPTYLLHMYTSGGGTSSYAVIQNAGTTPNDDIASLVVRGGATNANWFFGTNRADVGGAAANLFIYNGTTTNKVTITPAGSVGIGTTSPAQALEVNGQIKVDSLATASSTSLCITSTSNGVIATCSSSIRYKESVRDADFGLKQIMAMRPVTFRWKGRDESDFGLIAEEVAKIDPRYVTYKAGQIEGVKYPQLTAVLVNAVKELKASNDDDATEIARLRAQNKSAEGQLKKQAAEIVELTREQHASDRRFQAQLIELQRQFEIKTARN
jgi:hypothetical protein